MVLQDHSIAHHHMFSTEPFQATGTKRNYTKPVFRGNSSRDPADHLKAGQDDFFISNTAPFHAMRLDGVIDRKVRFSPVLEGLSEPEYMHWMLGPFTDFPVQTLEEMSSRENLGPAKPRCFERVLLCKPRSWQNQRHDLPGYWYHYLKFGQLGQDIVNHHRKDLDIPEKDSKAFKVMFVERIVKRRILNMDEALSKCRSWTPPQASGFTHTECGVINTDNGSHWKQHMAIMQTVDVLVGLHGAGLTNHNFQRPGTALVEIFACSFYQDAYFQQTSRVQKMVLPFQIVTNDTGLCQPGIQERSADIEGKKLLAQMWVPGSLLRDQDVKLNMNVLFMAFERILSLNGSADAYLAAEQRDRNFAVLTAR
eukprot:jgi/Astpho2/929/Aster-00767